MTLDCLLTAAGCDVGRPLAELGDERLHPLTPPSEDLRLALDLRGEDAHALSVQREVVALPCNSGELDKRPFMTQSEQCGGHADRGQPSGARGARRVPA